jgi:hypothetical protein
VEKILSYGQMLVRSQVKKGINSYMSSEKVSLVAFFCRNRHLKRKELERSHISAERIVLG